MKNILIFALFILISPGSLAFNLKDLKQLQDTCSCQNCDLSNADLANFKLGDNNTLQEKKARMNSNGYIICNISGANFSGANLTNAYFTPSDFGPGINNKVGKILMKRVNFSNALLSRAHFNAVAGDGCSFEHANMNSVTMLKGSSFKDANFAHAAMQNASVSPPMGGCGAFFNNSDFSHSNLSNSKLIADFTGANFSGANLMNSTINPCDNQPQDAFKGSIFFSANLLHTVINNQPVTESMLVNAKLCKTQLPSGISNRDCGSN